MIHLRLIAEGGLARRLQALASARLVADRVGAELTLDWRPDAECGAAFSDLFEPNVNEDGARLLGLPERQIAGARGGVVGVPGNLFGGGGGDRVVSVRADRALVLYPADQDVAPADLRSILRSFAPVPDISRRVRELAEELGPRALGIHLRTGGTRPGQRAQPMLGPDVFKAFDPLYERLPDVRFYVASDAPALVGRFAARYGRCVVSSRGPAGTGPGRAANPVEDVREAVVDLLVLARTSRIVGTNGSTFSALASLIGDVPLWELDERQLAQERSARPVDAETGTTAGGSRPETEMVAVREGVPARPQGGHALEAVLPLTLGDCERADALLLKSLEKYFPELPLLWIVVPGAERRAIRDRLQTNLPHRIVVEEDVVPELSARGPARDAGDGSRKNDWFAQQLIKLAMAEHVAAECYLTLDADALCVKPTRVVDLVRNGRGLCRRLVGDVHGEWYAWASRVLEIPRSRWIHDVTPALLHRRGVWSMARYLENLEGPCCAAGDWLGFGQGRPGAGWRKLLLERLPWTEYVLYHTFLEATGQFPVFHFESPARHLLGDSVWGRDDWGQWRPESVFSGTVPFHFAVVQSTTKLPVPEVADRLRPWLA